MAKRNGNDENGREMSTFTYREREKERKRISANLELTRATTSNNNEMRKNSKTTNRLSRKWLEQKQVREREQQCKNIIYNEYLNI